ncbi:hypothetical protein [Polaromonas jejuensis]|uniref:PASTA domain-containing protein n=1 Tax=Polaromonas jejuensis TaxID=457502 RepID=A0ABW0QEK7_9BURK|nr:hypothetical protein [Polaromonas jejuensis]
MVTRIKVCLLMGVGALGCLQAAAQNAPGEDPVRLDKKITIQMLPLGAAPRSGNINPSTDMPAWQRARVARYEAKAFSGNPGDILSKKDVVSTATSDGFKTTCTQTIGSNVATTTPAGSPKEQIVVLRGDLVNICN